MRKLNLLVVLQTHSVKSRDTTKQRYCGASKAEIMRRCVTSLVDSINYASDMLPHVDISLQVFLNIYLSFYGRIYRFPLYI
jgi:hypothetical protein